MKTIEIKQLKQSGLNNDSIYQIAAGQLNLFCVAFFGYKGSKGDKAKLNRVWNRIINN